MKTYRLLIIAIILGAGLSNLVAQNLKLSIDKTSLKYGFINDLGETVIPFVYEKAFNFNEKGFTLVKKDGKTMIINSLNQIMFSDLKYDSFAVKDSLGANNPLWRSRLVGPFGKDKFLLQSNLFSNTPTYCIINENGILEGKWEPGILQYYDEEKLYNVRIVKLDFGTLKVEINEHIMNLNGEKIGKSYPYIRPAGENRFIVSEDGIWSVEDEKESVKLTKKFHHSVNSQYNYFAFVFKGTYSLMDANFKKIIEHKTHLVFKGKNSKDILTYYSSNIEYPINHIIFELSKENKSVSSIYVKMIYSVTSQNNLTIFDKDGVVIQEIK